MTSSTLRFSLLIPSFRSLRYLEKCLGSLINLPGPSYEVLFLDNGSPEPEAEWVRNNISDPRFRVFKLPTTSFFAGGINFLAKHAHGEFLILMNSDTWVEPDWLQILDAYLQKTGYEGANADVRDLAQPEKSMDKKFCLDPFGLIHYVPLESSNTGPMFIPAGLGMTIKKSVFYEVGAMDDDYKMYFEDIDLSWRVCLQGYQMGYAPGAVIHHVGQGSSVKTFFLWNRFRGRRNRIWTYFKNAGPLLLAVFIPTHVLICLASIAGNLLLFRYQNALAETAALFAAFFHLGNPLSKRGTIQVNRKLTDRELIQRGFVVLRIKYLDRVFGLFSRMESK